MASADQIVEAGTQVIPAHIAVEPFAGIQQLRLGRDRIDQITVRIKVVNLIDNQRAVIEKMISA